MNNVVMKLVKSSREDKAQARRANSELTNLVGIGSNSGDIGEDFYEKAEA
jgi:hypothetical protein